MLVTLAIVAAVLVASAALATALNARRPDVPTAPQFATPQQLDRADFDESEVPWLLVLFSSATCLSCNEARDALAVVGRLAPPEAARIHVEDLGVEEHREVHTRYRIDAVPSLVLADAEGVVRWSYLGAPPAEEISDLLVEIGLAPPASPGTAVDLP